MNIIQRSLLALTVVAALPGGATGQDSGKIKVACTIPALKSIAAEIAGDGFEVFALSKPDQDVHHISPTPLLVNKVREAALFIEIGLQLEIWAPEVVNNAANSRIVPGAEGHVVASAGIPREDMPKIVDRAQGDIHPEGNPHIWLDPLRAKGIAENIAAAFKRVAPGRADDINRRLERFKARIDEAIFGPDLVKLVGSKKLTRLTQDGELWKWLQENEADGAKLSTKIGGWLKKGEPLRGVAVIEFHRTWIYLAKLLGFEIVGAIEPKPGIEITAKHYSWLVETVKARKAQLILVDNFYNAAAPRRLVEDTSARVVILPGQPGGEPETDEYIAFIDRVITKMVDGLKAEGK
ncbi:MAG TPA: metal ABC transporter substrate-binding protein [Planctomycetota bacterium]|jgi:zinc/manganese transport system substrate-binding protein